MSTEAYFERFRQGIVGHDHDFETPYGRKQLIYADWIASGRLYGPIEDKLHGTFGPWVGNTHSESSVTGTSMTRAYHEARHIIKRHVNAGPNDVIIATGSGMTGVINKLQRILGLRIPEPLMPHVNVPESERPVILLTHMEHHSNQTSWLETIADVHWLEPMPNGECCMKTLREAVKQYEGRRLIGSFTACSNVTGVRTPYHEMARIMHEAGGLCFVDFAASAPYDPIDMHPEDEAARLDAVFFSPHKFLGGPGSAGIMVFDSALDPNHVPDEPGGGTVDWTNPWGEHRFVSNIEDREDGGTPAFLQTIRAALCIKLKEEITCDAIHVREKELLDRAFEGLGEIPGLVILAEHLRDRLGVISFYFEGIHYNLVVKLLNDRFGIQVRGGCSCAGTYGHYLLHVDPEHSHRITDRINEGDLSEKPGWVRLSLHPTMTDAELEIVIDALAAVRANITEWEKDYRYDPNTNEYVHREERALPVEEWFSLEREGAAL
ncbi:MAG: aminotransferase class V-fold PLP-dependent enzyme [Rhodothermales bacterium]|nr:aminotransferase class V-fold PLP-dependent enzyme [Rhodothermales bacterium]MBO6779028.1 aminotransferase class V-fold PLP-dependent enzyme [Rhodothermales bacterium]